MTRALTRIQEFLKLEASAGLVLMAMALLAMLFANTTLAPIYSGILDTNVRIGIASFEISKPALLWINDGLMAIFFFLVGLEIKREVLAGELSSFDKAALPIIAALGGMAVPGLVYYFINSGSPETLVGWAIPTATDIAFALGFCRSCRIEPRWGETRGAICFDWRLDVGFCFEIWRACDPGRSDDRLNRSDEARGWRSLLAPPS